MSEINLALLGVTILFFILLAVKSLLGKNKIKKNFCVICFSVSLTWIFLLVLYFSGLFNNTIIISLLIGMSLTGIYYFIESKVKTSRLKIFRLPFVLTLITIAYYFLTFEKIINSVLVIGTVWFLFVLIYLYNNPKFTRKLLKCCKE